MGEKKTRSLRSLPSRRRSAPERKWVTQKGVRSKTIRLRDLPPNPKWKALNEPDTMLVHVVLPKAEEAAATTDADAPAAPGTEPEVIKKGKTDKEGEEPKK